ncbi:hypothetical protein BGZ99_008486 [Dissophora globulifera]|uniref:Yeast cell wall synthesis Kre9/Knh1-like N-terminal domain-containing protein n=1 Tax=Dissophora globulifera TaxID=979702 RepID=A0A9P6RV99_9FUNG|nr:hypothetical protein BGZ99_008486 [Dissophora globulifera]
MIFSKSFTTLAMLAMMVATAQADMLSISNPTKGTTWKVGETVFLQWKGNCASMGSPAAKSVDVNLMSGPDTALRFVAKLASIDCSGSETRKEFSIPADVVALSGDYSLQVQTEPKTSYSNIFTIQSKNDSGDVAANGAAVPPKPESAAVANTGAGVTSDAATLPLKNVRSTATASAVALAAVFVAAQLL